MYEVFLDTNILRLQSNFIKWADEIGDMSDAYKTFVPSFQRSREGWIYAGRTVDGKKFAPLSPRYAITKNLLYGNQPILIASGKMINAIRGHQGWKQRITKDNLFMEIDLPYASYHQDGTSKMPQRNYFLTKNGTLNKMDYAQLMQAMEGRINEVTEARLNQTIVEMARGK